MVFTRISPDHRRVLHDLLLANGHVRPAGVRLAVTLPVTCRFRGQARLPLQGWTADMSRGGLSFDLPQLLPTGTDLVVTVRHPTGPLSLAGTVVWVEASRRRPPRGSIHHGFQFTVLDAAVELALARLLTRMPRFPQPLPRAAQGLLLP